MLQDPYAKSKSAAVLTAVYDAAERYTQEQLPRAYGVELQQETEKTIERAIRALLQSLNKKPQ